MEIYLIRHPSVDIEEGTIYGQADVDVSNEFMTEVSNLKKLLSFSKDMIFYSSPLKRCVLLANELSDDPPIIDSRLMEVDFGEWELKKWDDLDRIVLNNWMDDIVNNTPPKGESYIDLVKRVTEIFLEMISENQNNVVIVTHLSVIRSILTYILKNPLEKSFIFDIEHASVSKISAKFDERNQPFFKIRYINRK